MQNDNLFVTLLSIFLGSILDVIAVTLWSMDVKIKAFVHCCLTSAMLCTMLILCYYSNYSAECNATLRLTLCTTLLMIRNNALMRLS